MKNQVRNAYRHLGLPQALGWANVIVAFSIQISGSAIASLIDYSQRPVEFFTIRVVALCVFALVIWLGRLALNRFGKTRPLPLVTIVTLASALIVSTFVFDSLLVSTGFTDKHVLIERLISSAPGIAVSQILTSLLVTYAVDYSQKNALLAQAEEELLTTRTEATNRISQRKIELISSIRKEISEQLEGLRAGAKDNLSRMQALIDDVVRPISYSLVYEVEAEPDVVQKLETKQVDWKSVLRSSLFRNPFHWIATPSLIGAISASFLIASFQLRGLIAFIAIAFVSAGSTFLGHKIWGKLPESAGVFFRAILFTAYNLVLAWLCLLLISEITGSEFIDPYRLPAWLVIFSVAAWTVSLVSEVNTMLRQTNVNLTRSISELKREVVALNSSYRQFQREISRVLHGPVQQAIHATLVRVKNNPNESFDEDLVEDLQARITQALDSLNSPNGDSESLVQVLTNLQALWQGNVEIQFYIDKPAEAALNSNPATSLSVSELVQEATSNAIRHGEASEVRIEVQVTEDQRNLEITVSNNGSPISASAKPGLGSQLFEELTLHWRRTQNDNKGCISAQLPVIQPSEKR